MSRIQNAMTNAFFDFWVKMYRAVFPFIMRTVMLHTIGIGYLGLNGLFASVLQILSIGELGISGAIVYSMYEPVAKQDTKRICALLRLYRLLYAVIGVSVFVLGAAMIPILPRIISDEVPPDINIYILYMMYLASTALSYSVFSYRSSILEVYQRNRVINKINLVTMTVQFGLQILFLLVLRNYYVYIVTQFAVQLANQALVYWKVRKLYPHLKPEGKIEKQMVTDIVTKVKGLFFGRVAGIILNASDTVIISAFLGLTMLAVYQNYFFILTAIIGFISSLLTGSLAGVGNSLVTETKEKNYQDFRRFTFLLSWIVCVCTSCFLVLFQPFMKLWMGEDKMLSMGMVLLFCAYFLIFEYNQLFNLYKDAAGLWYEDRFRPLVTALANLGMNLFFVRHIGLYGIIASTVLSMLCIGMPWLLHNLFGLLFHRSALGYLKELASYAAVTVLSCGISWFATRWMDLDGLLGLFVYAVVAAAVPFGMYLVIFRKNPYFKDTMELARCVLVMGRRNK